MVEFFKSKRGLSPLALFSSRKEPVPAIDHLIKRPTKCLFNININMQHDMIVVRHHRIAAQINRQYLRQFIQAIFNPLATVLKTTSVCCILTAQKSTA